MSQSKAEKARAAARSPAGRAARPPRGMGSANAMGNQDLLHELASMRSYTEQEIQLTPELEQLARAPGDSEKNPAAMGQYGKVDGQLFGKDRLSAMQGAARDGYLFGAMLAIAKSNPQLIKDLVKDNGDGTYDVTLYMKEDVWSFRASPITITVDAQFPITGQAQAYYAIGVTENDTPELWAMLIEKAYAIQMGEWKGYGGINEEAVCRDGKYAGALTHMLGKREVEFNVASLGPREALKLIQDCIRHGWPITALANDLETLDEEDKKDADKKSVVSGHTYSPSDVEKNLGKVDLENPWGALHLKNLSAEDFARFFKSITVCKLPAGEGSGKDSAKNTNRRAEG